MRKRNLDQVLRIRGVMEDLARAEMEMRSSAVRQLEDAASRQRGAALVIRRDGWEELAKREAGEDNFGGENAWLLGLTDAEILEWKSERSSEQAEAEKPALAKAREAMMERRRERQQMETLVDVALRLEVQTLVRREQQQIDDWFQGRASRIGKGRILRKGAASPTED